MQKMQNSCSFMLRCGRYWGRYTNMVQQAATVDHIDCLQQLHVKKKKQQLSDCNMVKNGGDFKIWSAK